MLFRLASDTEDNDEALGKHIWPFSFCPLLCPSSFRDHVLRLSMAWHLSAATALFEVAARCRLVYGLALSGDTWLQACVTGFLHITVGTLVCLSC